MLVWLTCLHKLVIGANGLLVCFGQKPAILLCEQATFGEYWWQYSTIVISMEGEQEQLQ